MFCWLGRVTNFSFFFCHFNMPHETVENGERYGVKENEVNLNNLSLVTPKIKA